MTHHKYEDLIVWQKAMDLVEEIYTLTKAFPAEERFGLVSQMRRCAVSIPSNIAEGSRRGGNKEFSHFLLIAFGSGAELETQIKIVKRLQYVKNNDITRIVNLLDEIMKMLNVLQSKMQKHS